MIRKLALKIVLFLLLLLVLMAAAGYLLRAQLVRKFINSANNYLVAPVQVGTIDVSLFRHFPDITISLKNVTIKDIDDKSTELLRAKRISFTFDPIELAKGNYQVHGMEVLSARANLRWIDEKRSNFLIFKNSDKEQHQKLNWDLKDITFKDVSVSYNDPTSRISHQFESELLKGDVSYSTGRFDIITKGDLHVIQLGFNDEIFLPDKKFNLGLFMALNTDSSLLQFQKAEIRMDQSEFDLNGFYDYGKEDKINITIKGIKTDLNAITSFLPRRMADQFEVYKSQGNLYFQLKLLKDSKPFNQFKLESSFGASNSTFFDPKTGFKLNDASFSGSFFYEESRKGKIANLSLNRVEGKLNGKSFFGSLAVSDPAKPYIKLLFEGELDIAELKNLVQDSLLHQASGSLNLKLTFNGYLDDLKNQEAFRRVSAAGELKLKNFSFQYGNKRTEFKNWSGLIAFNQSTLSTDHLEGYIGQSDFEVKGKVKNSLPFLLTSDSPIGIDAQISSNHLDVDQLLSLGFGELNNGGYNFSISPLVYLRLKYQVDDLKYRRLRSKKLSGSLQIKNQEVLLNQNTMKAMGGTLSLDAQISAHSKKDISISAKITCAQVNLDSIFYVFEDFNQDFISQKHLKGQVKAEINLQTRLKQSLEFIPESLTANLSLVISNGQLNDFEPMLGLNKYLDDGGLRKLRFADLKNEIFVQDKTIYIPRMDIKSNLTDIQISGRHTFDQRIDYHVIAPLTGRRKVNKAEAGNALTSDLTGKPKLFLKITGTTDNYQIGYDMDAVKQKIANDIKNEVKSFKESFKAKEKPKNKKAELAEDEYFDWDNN